MIIKTTFNDNDFTHLLKGYWDQFWFKNYYLAINKIEDAKQYREERIDAEEILEKIFYNEDKTTVKELRKFENIISNSILEYIKENDLENYEYLKRRLCVNIRLVISDKDENGEKLYYFIKQKQYIVM